MVILSYYRFDHRLFLKKIKNFSHFKILLRSNFWKTILFLWLAISGLITHDYCALKKRLKSPFVEKFYEFFSLFFSLHLFFISYLLKRRTDKPLPPKVDLQQSLQWTKAEVEFLKKKVVHTHNVHQCWEGTVLNNNNKKERDEGGRWPDQLFWL